MKLLLRIVGALAIVAVSFFTTLWLLDRNSDTCPSGRTIALNRPFAKYSGSAFVKDVKGTDVPGDATGAATRSRLLLCEDGNLIGTPHSIHGDIAQKGGGRYSHWGTDLIFSTSDNSDPNSNGRSYVAVEPR